MNTPLNLSGIRLLLKQGFSVVSGFPEAVIAMRFLGFLASALVVLILAILNRLSFELGSIPGLFALFILLTTILFSYFKNLRSELWLSILLALDMVGISLAIHFVDKVPSALTPLYLIPLISATLLSRKIIFSLAIFGLASYSLVVYTAATSSGYLTDIQITQIALVALVIGISIAESWYSTHMVKEKNKQALRLKDQFVFTTAHDLRAPFALIRLLAEKYGSGQPGTMEDLRDDMEAIDENVSSATQLLDDLLLLAKGENVRLNRSAIDLPELLDHLLEHWRAAVRQKNIQIIYKKRKIPFKVLGDKQRIGYAFDNVISNSIKYNKHGGTVRIWHEIEGDLARTNIEDTGCGISQENVSEAFTPYFREKKDPRIPGTGLGLYSAKQFIEKMKGSISIVSSKQGTRVTISLPVKS